MSTIKYLSGYEKIKKKRKTEEFLQSQVGAMDKFLSNTSNVDKEIVTPQTRGSVDYPSTRGLQGDVGLPDATSENRAESPLYEELYPNKTPA